MFNDITWTRFTGKCFSCIGYIMIDHQGRKWIGTCGGGVYIYDDVNWINYNVFNSDLPTNWPYPIVEDHTGIFWFATDDFGLVRFDGDLWKVYNQYNSALPDFGISGLYIDPSDNLWVATASGLYTFNGTDWITFYPPEGQLPYPSFLSIVPDDSMNLWLPTQYGIAKFYDYPVLPHNPVTLIDNLSATVMISPNPVSKTLRINFIMHESKIQILDMSGKLLISKNADSNIVEMDVSSLQNGIYFIRIQLQNGSLTRKFIKQ
jgi:hypothetical protein